MALKLQKHRHMQGMDQIHEARSRWLAESWKACHRKPENCDPSSQGECASPNGQERNSKGGAPEPGIGTGSILSIIAK